VVRDVDDLERGREAYARRAWVAAYESLARADRATTLGAGDLELLARSAYMLGRDDLWRQTLERAYQAYRDAGELPGAARCTWWVGHNLLFRGEAAPAKGWFGRGQRLLERHEHDCAERGYLLFPLLLQHVIGGEYEAAYAIAVEAGHIGERFGDKDLVAMAQSARGQALVRLGRTDEGLRLVDEAMVAVTAAELSPIAAGIVYCDTIAFCRDVYELRRAREWTAALTRWCDEQRDMVAHKGLCLVHRAEIMTLEGAWTDALEEARRVSEQFTQGVMNQRALGHAAYRQAEVHRLRGEHDAAELAYREASLLGREPQPGLAMLRLAQGKTDAAATTIRRAVGETILPLKRAALLPAYVEIMLAGGDLDAARAACRELEQIAERQASEMLGAAAAYARGQLALAELDAQAAVVALRRAWESWQQLGAPYEAARARALLGSACFSLGDDDTASLELDAARSVFAKLGAAPDVVRAESLTRRDVARDEHGLTARQLEVLRLVAAGKSNREIAAALVISEHTVARHLQDVYAKLGVSSRTAASRFAFEHDLV
jgi:DNA-binding CsgD family transcriptional regulator